MRLVAIETSCDETAIAVLDADRVAGDATFRVLGNALHTQIELHKEYGGVFPALAKRAHAENLVPVLEKALGDATLLSDGSTSTPDGYAELLSREYELSEALRTFLSTHAVPDIDGIAVTSGPGLEPALWVGINFAKALALAWGKPLVAVNHMEGHLLAGLATIEGDELRLTNIPTPVLGLLISGGHTELVLMNEWQSYKVLGETRDDAVGEAFDKVARMMDLPYPGGPEISKLAEKAREQNIAAAPALPRPMLRDDGYDFSFSGLKTAVLYYIKEKGALSDNEKMALAREFEDAVGDVFFYKTTRALDDTGAQTLVLGGGVSANHHLQNIMRTKVGGDHPAVSIRIPDRSLTTDNAVMIGIASYFHALNDEYADRNTLRADGTLALTSEVLH